MPEARRSQDGVESCYNYSTCLQLFLSQNNLIVGFITKIGVNVNSEM